MNKIKVLNSGFKRKIVKKIEKPPIIQLKDEDSNNDAASDISEHYVLEYKDEILNVIKQKEDEDDNNTEMDIENDVEDDLKSESVQEILEHICGKCYKSFSSFQLYKAHSMYCKNESEIAKNIADMMNNLKTIEQESIEIDKIKNICFCCKENWETAHSGHIRCPRCPKSFKNTPSFERHLFLIHYDTSDHECKTCNAKCPSELILKLHEKAHKRGKPFACKKCGEEFTRKYHLNRHHLYTGCEINYDKRVVLCKVCGKEFYRLDNLRMHLKQHLSKDVKSKDYPCPYCSKAFYGTATLNIHIRTHTGERPFNCDLCGTAFPSNPALRKHRRTHTGERPYQCSRCYRSFAAKEVLNRHMKTHTGEKPHECKLCQKRFIQATQLKQHLITHEKKAMKGVQRCRKCSTVCDSKALLSKHMKEEHTIIRPDGSNITCFDCNKTFMTDGGLKRHITRIHVRKIMDNIEGTDMNDENIKLDLNEISCNICNEVFENVKSLEFHRLKVHDNFNDKEKVKVIQNNEEQESEEWSCQFCYQKFCDNDKFIKHMENDHGAIVLSVDNQTNEEYIIDGPLPESKTSDKEEKIELIDVVDEVLEYIDEGSIKTIKVEEKNNEKNIVKLEKIKEVNDDELEMPNNHDVKFKKPKEKIKSGSPTSLMNETLLTENIIKLLQLLIEQDTLLKFGFPNAPIEEILLKVIRNCGHKPRRHDKSYDKMARLRDYVKILFTVVVDNDSIKELLNNHPIDKVICQVLDMAKKELIVQRRYSLLYKDVLKVKIIKDLN